MPFQSLNESPSSVEISAPDLSDRCFDWREANELTISPSETWKQWLFDTGSLTQLLIHKSQNNFRVEVLSEEWVIQSGADIRSRFGPLSVCHKFWSRKVLLLGNGKPWVFAHTLVPEHSLLGPLKQVQELNEKPLGEYLFSYPDLVRSAMDITAFAGDSWARRSLFNLFAKPVMVAEFFLPELLY